jgi:hypothetical protein
MDDARLTSRADNNPDIYAIVSAFRATHDTAIWTTDDAAFQYAHDTAYVSSIRRAFE